MAHFFFPIRIQCVDLKGLFLWLSFTIRCYGSRDAYLLQNFTSNIECSMRKSLEPSGNFSFQRQVWDPLIVLRSEA